jgi:hypothetical protein
MHRTSAALSGIVMALAVAACSGSSADAEAVLVRKIREANDPKLNELTEDQWVEWAQAICDDLDAGFDFVDITISTAQDMTEAGGADYIQSTFFLFEEGVRTLCPRHQRQIP